jgi:hypothetical protein
VEHKWQEEGHDARRRLHDRKGAHTGKPPISDPPPSLKVEWWGAVWNGTSTVDLGTTRLTLQIHAWENYHIGPPKPIKGRTTGGGGGGGGLEWDLNHISGRGSPDPSDPRNRKLSYRTPNRVLLSYNDYCHYEYRIFSI